MEEKDLEHRFHLMHKEIEAAVSLIQDLKLDLFSAIDALKIEVEVLHRFMQRYHPDFARVYADLRAEVIQEVDPEWMEAENRERKE
ncbi:MAG: hypothetical protein HYT78_16220 [Deltaproteobacteria bacterium]|nr:hypothetical protein [Deltaproteobacteria bacterium]